MYIPLFNFLNLTHLSDLTYLTVETGKKRVANPNSALKSYNFPNLNHRFLPYFLVLCSIFVTLDLVCFETLVCLLFTNLHIAAALQWILIGLCLTIILKHIFPLDVWRHIWLWSWRCRIWLGLSLNDPVWRWPNYKLLWPEPKLSRLCLCTVIFRKQRCFFHCNSSSYEWPQSSVWLSSFSTTSKLSQNTSKHKWYGVSDCVWILLLQLCWFVGKDQKNFWLYEIPLL